MLTEGVVRRDVFLIQGITCLDCAQKFEQTVKSLKGVSHASLNAITGKLSVEGAVDLKTLQALGKEEGYTVTLAAANDGEGAATEERKIDWALFRAVLSGLGLVMGYGAEYLGGSLSASLPAYGMAVLLGGWGNFKKAAFALPRGNFNMAVLMSVAVIGAMLIGQYEEGATVAFLFSISEMLESWTMDKARRSIRQLMDLAPKTARIFRAGKEIEVPVESVCAGEVMIILPGEKISLDGIVIKGESAVNQAAITGESIPAEKSFGAEVYAGTLNTTGALEVRITKRVQDTTLAKIIHMVESAQGSRAPSQVFVEKFAAVYTPIVMVLALGIVLVPPLAFGYEWSPWIYRGLALLVVACPCALVVSTPVAVVSAISNAARQGVLIKGGIHLEEMSALNAIAFDKTGTLTQGEPAVTDVIATGIVTEDQLLSTVADLEARSEHPLAEAAVKAAKARGHQVHPVEDFTALPGRGAQGTLCGDMVYIGNSRLFREMGLSIESLESTLEKLQQQGKTAMLVGTKAAVWGVIAVADAVRDGSAATLAALKQAGIQRTVMLTGDNERTARSIAEQVGADEVRAELLPQDKVSAIRELLGKYGKVAMVGDGINDAPALALSSVGVAMGGAGADAALETADIALMADDIGKLPFILRLSKMTLGIIRQNIGFSLLIKTVAVLAVFPGWLTLWLAILADMGASLIVTLNSLRLLRVEAKV